MTRGGWRSHLDAALLALGFMTTLPVPPLREVRDADFARAKAYFPLAGYVVGGAVALALTLPLPAGVGAALGVGAWLALTGMLHFDGLVDSADALFAVKSPEQRLAILRDVHVGAFGLATGVVALLLFWSLLSADLPVGAPIASAVLARAALLWPMQRYPAARAGSSGARARAGGNLAHWTVAALLSLPALLLPGGWAAALGALLASLLAARFTAARLGGGLTGDSYGLIVITAELAALLTFVWGRG